jgi:hypothetical protein
MNLADKITIALRETPMKLPVVIDFINAESPVEWSAEFLTQHVNTLLWRGSIVRDSRGVLSVPAKEMDEPVDSPPTF